MGNLPPGNRKIAATISLTSFAPGLVFGFQSSFSRAPCWRPPISMVDFRWVGNTSDRCERRSLPVFLSTAGFFDTLAVPFDCRGPNLRECKFDELAQPIESRPSPARNRPARPPANILYMPST